MYGAGEVAEILLLVLNDSNLSIDVLGVIDDDKKKENSYIVNYPIISRNDIKNIEHDGILISSYTKKEQIYEKLLSTNYNTESIIKFFDIL